MQDRAILIGCKDEKEAYDLYRNSPDLKGWLISSEMKYFEAIPVHTVKGTYGLFDKDGNKYPVPYHEIGVKMRDLWEG